MAHDFPPSEDFAARKGFQHGPTSDGCEHTGTHENCCGTKEQYGRSHAITALHKFQEDVKKSKQAAEAQARKATPAYSGFLKYFPDAVLAVAELSRIGNDQHNPGEPLHWAREKSGDESDAELRHMIDQARGIKFDTDGVRHATKRAWRAMAFLQKELEADGGFKPVRVGEGINGGCHRR